MFRVFCALPFSSRNGLRHIQTTPITQAIELKMPSLSPTMETGSIVKWVVKPGDIVNPGDVICEIQTDKAVMAMECDEEGVLAHILVDEGKGDIPVGQTICVMAEPEEDWKSVEKPTLVSSYKPKAEPKQTGAAKPKSHEGRISNILGPAAKLLMLQYDVTKDKLNPTGPFGIPMKTDVLDYIRVHKLVKVEQREEQALPHKTSTAFVNSETPIIDIPLSSMRKTIAKRLTLSKQSIPHAYASISADLSSITSIRNKMKAEGIKVSVNDFIVKAVGSALLAVPSVNSSWENDTAILHSTCDICVAVATPNGLITPIVKDVHLLDVQGISNTVKELATKAKDGKLQLHEFQGGNFTISNLGMFGISAFSAIINPPQTAILAVGGAMPNLSIHGATNRMTLTLCFDNRAISEFEAARFLGHVRNIVESCEEALLGPQGQSINDLHVLQALL